MGMTLAQLAKQMDATFRGDGQHHLAGCAGLAEATGTDISFVANPKYTALLNQTQAGAVVVSPADAKKAGQKINLLITDNPYFVFRQAVVALHGFRKQPNTGISSQAIIDPTAQIGQQTTIEPMAYVAKHVTIGKRCVIYPHCYIGPNVTLGDDCILYPHVVIYDFCKLGHRVILQAGCVIGQDGFGYATHALPQQAPAHHKIPQVGNVEIDDDVEMGASCSINRATVGSTRIGKGTKFSDLVAIGHGTHVGEHNLIVAQVGLAGSVKTGQYVVMGGQVGVAGHLKIGNQVQLAAKSGVMTDVPDNAQYGGQPAIDFHKTKRNVLNVMKLSAMQDKIKSMHTRIKKLEGQLDQEK